VRADQVLVTEAADTPFSVISPQRRLQSGRTLYKLFSPAPLGHELHRLFSNLTKVDHPFQGTVSPSWTASSRHHGATSMCARFSDPHSLPRWMQVAEQNWHAYPKFAPPEEFAPFELAKGIYYNNALENAASAMEMSALAAKNNALLVQQHLSLAWRRGQEHRLPDALADA
jgi:Prenylcysteine lyase